MAIKKIIVELDDRELTFQEFNSVSEFQASEVYLSETNTVAPKVIDAEVIVEPEAPVAAPEEVVTPTE